MTNIFISSLIGSIIIIANSSIINFYYLKKSTNLKSIVIVYMDLYLLAFKFIY